MVDPSGDGRLFARTVRASLADCAPTGRMRLDAVARVLQDVAYEDVEDAGLASAAVWIVRRTRILVRAFPRFAQTLTVQTFCSGVGRMWAERRTTLRCPDGQAAIDAVALWVHLDPDTRQPAPFTPAEFARYGETGSGRRVTARLRHPAPDPAGERRSWAFRTTDLDLAGHVNNAAYWAILEDELLLGEREPEAIDAEIEFRSASQPGIYEVAASGDLRWVLDGAGSVVASIRIGHPAGREANHRG
jgi:acyl-ACP thioesterase